jgi:hypothetical protein
MHWLTLLGLGILITGGFGNEEECDEISMLLNMEKLYKEGNLVQI